MFYMSLLEQDTIKKEQINEFLVPKFEVGDDKEYKMEAISNSIVFAKKVDGHLLRLYYLVT